MTTQSRGQRPQTADLEDPLYYLKNMDTVVSWVADHHADLLTTDELARLGRFFALSTAARGLLTRMVMRTGELFRVDKLNYPELPGSLADALAELSDSHWLESSPLLGIDDLFRLVTLTELRPVFANLLTELGLPKNLPKARMLEVLTEQFPEPQRLHEWLGDDAPATVRLHEMPLFDRIRLMFFGNLRQGWTDFVLVELGYQQYEQVTFSTDARAFHQRADVDCYLQMHQCRQWLDEGVAAVEVWPEVPAPSANPWLASRRDRLLLELGRQAERQGERELALEVLAASNHREARLKQLRLLERMKRYGEAWEIARHWRNNDLSDAEAQGLARILKRLAPKMGEAPPVVDTPPPIREFTLTLPQPEIGSVELAAQQHLESDEAPVFYVENTLINGLFGLLCWKTVFAAIPGAFFHPFHVGPADLMREDFVKRRQAAFERCFARLRDGSYRQRILETWQAKQGIANPFVVWPVLSEDLLIMAMDCIPAQHLERLFERLLNNLKEHRSGFPDLIRFRPDADGPESRYEMIEVKGPGDRLQDHQRRWLAFFAREGMPASVCYVRWQTDEACP
ncbi:VRR-NUC domain-containing protein [Marinobacter sp. NP-4(2019)]|uniref:VRR-NUC domain-containing protein n=1 Tax=Marinobacter sp. NP-4(2019) TaxID=2488665 RepID=UPI000FC3CED3|nr:VRR-NUC domain-containing protein [Marinobacter sp. NP-4(2019)]AZT82091.1 VRR-NUC domain-containing protein [Marinobacter sp. NP-4(2019)]